MDQVIPRATTCNPIASALSPIAIGIILAIANDPAAIAATRKILGIEDNAPEPIDPDARISKAQLARKLSVSVSTIDRLDREGAPFAYLGDQKRYRFDDYVAWYEARGKKPAAPEAAE